MSKTTEVPVRLSECRKIFGNRGRTWMSAIKRAMGVHGNFIMVSAVTKFIRENPTWTESDVYRRSKREWKIKTRAGSPDSQLSDVVVTHVISAPKVSRLGEMSVLVGRTEIKFAGRVLEII